MMCQRIGRPPTSTSGLGRYSVSSRRRVPCPPHRMTTFTSTSLSRHRARRAIHSPPPVAGFVATAPPGVHVPTCENHTETQVEASYAASPVKRDSPHFRILTADDEEHRSLFGSRGQTH